MEDFSIDIYSADKLFHVLMEIIDRPLFDDSARVDLIATDLQVKKLSTLQLTLGAQQGAKNIPLAAEMPEELNKIPHLEQLTSTMNEFKASACH